MFIPLILAAAVVPAPSPTGLRGQELLSSVTVSGTCTTGCHGERALYGSGEIVARNPDGSLVVLTARHVVANMSQPNVYLRNGIALGTHIASALHDMRGEPATVVAQSPQSDLALVRFQPRRDAGYAVASLSEDGRAQSGDIVGSPYGALWTVSPYRSISEADPDAQTSGAALVACDTCGPGDSGGGVFDERGSLAGILVSQQVLVTGDEPVAFGKRSSRFKIVPVATLRTFIASVPQSQLEPAQSLNDPWSRFARVPDASAPQSAGPTPGPDAWSRFARRPAQ